MKEKITAFIDSLILYDYLLFGGSFFLFILFLLLALLLRKKVAIASFFAIFAFVILIVAPTMGYIEMHKYLFKNTTTILSQKRLEFSDAIVLQGKLKNESKRNFKSCKITATVYKASRNKYKNYLYQFKVIQKMSIVEKDIAKGQERTFRILIEPFTYNKKYNITLGAKCI
jgi:hypothetical protein